MSPKESYFVKLYDRQGTPNATRIRIVLAEKRIEDEVEFATVDLIAAEQKQPAFLKMNPIGKTPVLELEDGLILSECTAITVYLDKRDGNPTLTGKTAREEAIIHMMQRRVEMMLLDPIDDYFHYATVGLGPALRPWRMPDWPGAKEWARRRGDLAVSNLPYFESILASRNFLAGEQFSMADITLYASVAFAQGAGLEVGSEFRSLWSWHERIESLPCVRNRSGREFLPQDISRRHPSK